MYNVLGDLVRRFYPDPVPSSSPSHANNNSSTAAEEEEEETMTTPPDPGDVAAVVARPSDGAADSAFFQHLPLDIRRLILLQAFGDRTVHVEYFFDSEEEGVYRRQQHQQQQAGGANNTATSTLTTSSRSSWIFPSWIYDSGRGGMWSRTEDTKQKPNGWCAFVCDSDSALASSSPPRGGESRKPRRGQWERGNSSSCSVMAASGQHDCWEEYRGLMTTRTTTRGATAAARERARIGVVGWLRTCRRAYIEGIEVLYPTNRFHIPNTTTIQHLLPLLLTSNQHPLAMITSVQLLWTLGRVARPPSSSSSSLPPSDPRFAGWHTFTSLLARLPSAFPRLRRLRLSLDGEWFPPQMAPNDVLRRFETDLLAPVDEMVKAVLLGGGGGGGEGNGDQHEAASSSLLLSSSYEITVAIPIPFCSPSSPVLSSSLPGASSSSSSPSWRDEMGLADDRHHNNDDDEDDEDESDRYVARIWRSLLPRQPQGMEPGEEVGYWITHISEAEDSRLFRTMPELLCIISQKS